MKGQVSSSYPYRAILIWSYYYLSKSLWFLKKFNLLSSLKGTVPVILSHFFHQVQVRMISRLHSVCPSFDIRVFGTFLGLLCLFVMLTKVLKLFFMDKWSSIALLLFSCNSPQSFVLFPMFIDLFKFQQVVATRFNDRNLT